MPTPPYIKGSEGRENGGEDGGEVTTNIGTKTKREGGEGPVVDFFRVFLGEGN